MLQKPEASADSQRSGVPWESLVRGFLAHWGKRPDEFEVEAYIKVCKRHPYKFVRGTLERILSERPEFAPRPVELATRLDRASAADLEAAVPVCGMPADLLQFWQAYSCGADPNGILPPDSMTRDGVFVHMCDAFGDYGQVEVRDHRWPHGLEPDASDRACFRYSDQWYALLLCTRLIGRAMVQAGPAGARDRFEVLCEGCTQVQTWVPALVRQLRDAVAARRPA